jgi:hypothetical protein
LARSPAIPTPLLLWPSIAEQAGIDPQQTAAIGQILKANPAAAGILAKSLGADTDNLGKNVLFGTTADGKTVAYQVGPDGHPHILDFGNTRDHPERTDQGRRYRQQPSHRRSERAAEENPAEIRGSRPGGDHRNERAREANNTNTTAITIAGMPARSKDGTAASAKGGDDGNVPTLLTNIEQGFNDLHRDEGFAGRRQRRWGNSKGNQPFGARAESRGTAWACRPRKSGSRL